MNAYTHTRVKSIYTREKYFSRRYFSRRAPSSSSAFNTQTANYRKSLSFIDARIGKSVSPLKYPVKRDACNDRGQVLSRLADFILYRLTHARAYPRESRVQLSGLACAHIYHVPLRRHPGQSASPVWFPVSRLPVSGLRASQIGRLSPIAGARRHMTQLLARAD